MKKFIIPIILAIFLVSGCVTDNPASKKEEKSRAKITAVESAQKRNESAKIEEIGTLAFGTDYALSKVTNAPREVVVAKDINQRIVSLAGSPTIEKMKEMQAMIDQLTSEIELTRKVGEEALGKKDLEISIIQEESKILLNAKDAQIAAYMDQARIAAANSDAYKAELAEYEGWFGLKAIGKGLAKLAKSAMWFLIIGGVLFIVLRIAAMSNPLAASVFSIFTTIASWFVRGIEMAVPKAVSAAGHVAQGTFNVYKSTLTKLVDNVQLVRDRAKTSGVKPTLEEVLDEVAKSMNDDEKQVVEELKKALHWK
jgi:hypothetical protein